jgi:hypothetical protein
MRKVGPLRYAELRKQVPTLSDKIALAGLISRSAVGDKSGADVYALTPRGRPLGRLLSELCHWGETNAASLGSASVYPQRIGQSGLTSAVRPARIFRRGANAWIAGWQRVSADRHPLHRIAGRDAHHPVR